MCALLLVDFVWFELKSMCSEREEFRVSLGTIPVLFFKIAPAVMAASPHSRLASLQAGALPVALQTLSERHDALLQVVHYLEGAYLLAQHHKTDKSGIEKEARVYLNEALTRVAADIDVAAANLEQYLSLQFGAVDALSQQVAGVQTSLSLTRSDAAKRRLADFLASVGGAAATATTGAIDGLVPLSASASAADSAPPMRVKFSKTFSESTTSSRVLKHNRRTSLAPSVTASKGRPTLNERLRRLDHIGTVLDFSNELAAPGSVGGGDVPRLTTRSSVPFTATPKTYFQV